MVGICENLHSFKESIVGAKFCLAETQTMLAGNSAMFNDGKKKCYCCRVLYAD